ncbi:E3 ubiquitin/ISG15 ligase TRIM25-like isoform X2 [Archocentrus centrarchus]|uniref:E3 ubiquitin/ISG15 ligase TRIM25-like isoform X2 n=1 Tax=Archocentrus centrarchus TaxID=63155 RepID=UPI0011E9D07B|nr:E3 ubiquitin/ISG15 ligase TRIM25-like isoform X2 [Archocentrus centrarchus]
MAEVDETQFSIMSLEDELICSICLSPFDCPVTIPCGHNFCRDCLLESWKDSYSCPQCRTVFDTKPELKKNTVLTAVVETLKVRSDKSEASFSEDENEASFSEDESEASLSEDESEAVGKDVIRCDTCMEAEASKTCLTCMASYCEEHLRPHRDNPVFRLHHLSEPVGDLSERICTEHHKLMEFFCTQHDRLICSFCLQQVHKGCSFMTPEEQRSLKESDLRNKLGLLNEKMEKTETVVFQMNNMQSKLKDAANKRKTALAAVYQQMRDLLAQDEREAQNEVDRELELGQMKLRNLTKKLNENCEKMGKTREDINSLLSESQASTFLQASVELPKVIKFEPHVPRINLDSKKVTATQAFAAALRETLMEMLNQPVEDRSLLLKPGETAAPVSGPEGAENTASQPESRVPSEQKSSPTVQGPLCHPPVQQYYQPVPIPFYIRPQQTWSAPQYPQAQPRGQHSGQLRFFAQQKTNQDRKPHGAPGGSKPAGKGSDSTKRDKPKGHPPSAKSNQDRKPHGAPGGSKPAGKGSDSTKKDKPKGHPPSAKSSTHRPHPPKNHK